MRKIIVPELKFRKVTGAGPMVGAFVVTGEPTFAQTTDLFREELDRVHPEARNALKKILEEDRDPLKEGYLSSVLVEVPALAATVGFHLGWHAALSGGGQATAPGSQAAPPSPPGPPPGAPEAKGAVKSKRVQLIDQFNAISDPVARGKFYEAHQFELFGKPKL